MRPCDKLAFLPAVPGRIRPARRRFDGFTLTELLVMVAVIGILGVMLFPALATAREKAQGTACINNLKHLTLAWSLYAVDNNDRLAPNGEPGSAGASLPGDPALQPGGAKAQWCPGSMRGNGATALPLGDAYIQTGLLYPFVNDLSAYKCPADQSVWPYPAADISEPRARSVSMNCWLNPIARSWNSVENYPAGKAQKVFTKFTSLAAAPGASRTWVFMDENPATIDGGFFVCDLAVSAWINVPASYHAGGGGISFADGHAQIRNWSDPKVLGFNNYQCRPPAISLGKGDSLADLQWLQQASSIILP